MRSEGKEQVIRNDIGGIPGGEAGGLEIISSGTYAGNIIRGNQALLGGSGGGILSYVGNPAITANTIVGNSAGGGGAVYFNPGGSARMQNNIVAFNSSGLYRHPEGVSVELSHNCFWQNGPYNYHNLEPGQSDVTADPQFVDTHGGNYHLGAASPCINAGSNAADGLPSRDIDGGRRIIAGLADLGADEFLAPPASDDRDGQSVALRGFPVTAVFDGFFYVESDDQSWGIRVVHSDGDVSPGTRVSRCHLIPRGRRGFIAASKVLGVGKGQSTPSAWAGRCWAGRLEYDRRQTGRRGVRGGEGLNSVGLLVAVVGVEHVKLIGGWLS